MMKVLSRFVLTLVVAPDLVDSMEDVHAHGCTRLALRTSRTQTREPSTLALASDSCRYTARIAVHRAVLARALRLIGCAQSPASFIK